MRVALVLITSNENEYLWEWCAFHRRLGIDELVIVDDKSALPVRDTVASFEPELQEAIQVFDCPFTHGTRQQATYHRMLKEHGSRFDFMGFIDTDEFIIPKRHRDIPETLGDYTQFGGLGINWQMFGSNGLRTRDRSQGVVDVFTRKAALDHRANRHVKSIVNTRHVNARKAPRDLHSFRYKRGFFCVNEKERPIDGPFSEPVSTELIQINHYYLRSREEFLEKCERGRADSDSLRSDADFENWDLELNTLDDLDAVMLKKRLFRAEGG